ncbi:TPA: 6-hydroxymethylpterin diphosphokinase MptE-like protein [Aeromonas veronii]
MSKIEMKEKLDSSLYRIYNSIVSFRYKNFGGTRKLLTGNTKFKNSHLGQRCFIMGTGPSLLDLTHGQVEVLKSEVIFGVNSLYKSEIGNVVIPKYYALLDNNYWESAEYKSAFNDIRVAYNDKLPTIITDYRAKEFLDGAGLKQETLYICGKKYPVDAVSFDVDECIYGLMNVVSYCIVSAMYMGFKEIYLLGCDYNAFCTYGRGHCYDDAKEVEGVSYNLAFYLKYYHLTTEFHYLISKLAKAHGIRVTNLTSVSLLDAYERKPVSAVLG